MAPQAKDSATLTRVDSESDMSCAGESVKSYRDYRVRKSNLIG